MRWLPVLAPVVAPFAFLAMTGELLPIETVLEEPTAYHLRQITIEGTLRQVRDLPSYFAKSGIQCFGAEVLLVDDGTGALEVLVPGVRGNPVAAQPMSEGERVRLGVVSRAGRLREVASPRGPTVHRL